MLLLSIPSPPLGRSAPLGPSVSQNNFPLINFTEKHGKTAAKLRPNADREGLLYFDVTVMRYSLVADGPRGEHVRLQSGEEALLVASLANLHVQQVGVQGRVVDL